MTIHAGRMTDERIRARQERKRSNASGAHQDKRTRRRRTRGDDRRRAIAESRER